MKDALLPNPHVGEILKNEFLEELGITQGDLASAIGVSPSIIDEITQTPSKITAEIDLRLCRYFKLSEGYFLRLQNFYELMEAKRALGETLNQIIPHSSLVNIN